MTAPLAVSPVVGLLQQHAIQEGAQAGEGPDLVQRKLAPGISPREPARESPPYRSAVGSLPSSKEVTHGFRDGSGDRGGDNAVVASCGATIEGAQKWLGGTHIDHFRPENGSPASKVGYLSLIMSWRFCSSQAGLSS